jgi:Predicted transcriptional regulator
MQAQPPEIAQSYLNAMSARPKNIETVALTLELLKRIPRNQKITVAELHRQLRDMGIDRTVRTIERQIDALVQHFDIECDDRSKPFGYRWKANAKGLSLPNLNGPESLLLALAQRHLQNLLPASVMKSMEGFFAQAKANLDPYSSKSREREWLDKVRVVDATQPLLPPTIKADVLEAVTSALYQNLWLTVDYKNARGTVATSNIMPLGLAQQGPRLYLVCRYEGFDNERSLAVHRIKSAAVSGLSFTRPPEFSLQKYDDDGRFGFGEGETVALSFDIEKKVGRHLLETPLAKDQVVTEHEDYYHISATVIDSKRLDQWLNGFARDVWGVDKQKKVKTQVVIAAHSAQNQCQ